MSWWSCVPPASAPDASHRGLGRGGRPAPRSGQAKSRRQASGPGAPCAKGATRPTAAEAEPPFKTSGAPPDRRAGGPGAPSAPSAAPPRHTGAAPAAPSPAADPRGPSGTTGANAPPPASPASAPTATGAESATGGPAGSAGRAGAAVSRGRPRRSVGHAFVAVRHIARRAVPVGVRSGRPTSVRRGLLVGHVLGAGGVRPPAENDDVRTVVRVGRIVEQEDVTRAELRLGDSVGVLREAARPFVAGQFPGHRDIARAVLPVSVGPVGGHAVGDPLADPGGGPPDDVRAADRGKRHRSAGRQCGTRAPVGAEQRPRRALPAAAPLICGDALPHGDPGVVDGGRGNGWAPSAADVSAATRRAVRWAGERRARVRGRSPARPGHTRSPAAPNFSHTGDPMRFPSHSRNVSPYPRTSVSVATVFPARAL